MNFYLPAHQGFARKKAPASVAPNWEKEDTFLLTSKQRRLVAMMDYRAARRMPTLHRDLAKILGIRRDSLKKLLRRTRKRLAEEGRDQSMNAKDAKDAKS